MNRSRPHGDWLLFFVTVPIALALIAFPFTWGPSLFEVVRDLGATPPILTRMLLDGSLTSAWGLASIALVALAVLPRMVRRGRRTVLVVALVWSCFGIGVVWLGVFLPVFGMSGG